MENSEKKSKLIIVTYLIYIIFWESLCIGGSVCMTIFFNKNEAWIVAGIILGASCFKPHRWYSLLDGIERNP